MIADYKIVYKIHYKIILVTTVLIEMLNLGMMI